MSFFNYLRQSIMPHQANEHPAASTTPNLVDEKQASPIAIIYRSELDYLSRCILDYPDIETGGQLFGFWTSQGTPVVLYVIGPGRNANHEITFFNQDVAYLDNVGNAILKKYSLQHIGEWHSHHQLGLARPSGHDAQTMFHGLTYIPQRRLLLCIGNYRNGKSSINPYNFHENDLHNYADALWIVKEENSPFRPLIDTEFADILIHPETIEPNHGEQRTRESQSAAKKQNTFGFRPDYWILQNGNIEVAKQMVAACTSHFNLPAATQVTDDGLLRISIDEGKYAIVFPADFPTEAPQLIAGESAVATGLWCVPEDDAHITESFEKWLKQNCKENNNQENTIENV